MKSIAIAILAFVSGSAWAAVTYNCDMQLSQNGKLNGQSYEVYGAAKGTLTLTGELEGSSKEVALLQLSNKDFEMKAVENGTGKTLPSDTPSDLRHPFEIFVRLPAKLLSFSSVLRLSSLGGKDVPVESSGFPRGGVETDFQGGKVFFIPPKQFFANGGVSLADRKDGLALVYHSVVCDLSNGS